MNRGGVEMLKTQHVPRPLATRSSGRRNVLRLLFLHVALLALVACGPDKTAEKRLVRSVGLPSELLLVTDAQVWQSDLSDSLTQLLCGPVPGLTQAEPFFRLTRILSQHYKPKFSTFHSKLFVRIDPSLRRPLMGLDRDVVARPQIEVTVAAPTLDALRAYLSEYGPRARQLLADAQIDMRAAQLSRKPNRRISSELDSLLGLTIDAPTELCATKRRDHFLWAGTNRNERDLNLVVYTYPWDGSEVLTPENFVHRRDSVMQAHIPGSEPDQWMATTRVDGRPVLLSEMRLMDGRRVQQVRGLWEMRNAALGGPFVALASVDTAQQRVVVAEGFVYSPSTDKRDLLRTLEASLRTLRKAPRK